jgi:hypothetical protein
MLRRCLYYIAFINIICFQFLISRQINFINEDIELKVGENSCTVTALYWFANQTPDPFQTTLFYPFVVDERLPYPDTISVVDVGKNLQTKFTKSKTGIFFTIGLSSFGTTLYRVIYRQRTFDRSMSYLLLTTSKWGKQLERGRYRVRIPDENVLTYSTLHFYQMVEQNAERIYETCNEYFMPSTDFIIKWERIRP